MIQNVISHSLPNIWLLLLVNRRIQLLTLYLSIQRLLNGLVLILIVESILDGVKLPVRVHGRTGVLFLQLTDFVVDFAGMEEA